ncbi:uncharacterized protein LOC112645962 isoform X2 [Canis lupus dingo]|uniref:uncharacterized protein LOC112645962 isoform X2 n=1 Tax=Canis lupus dingo TaxID=286419 RepID=UPI0015F164CC|nr:uncharacterized protein LOC112645962 isoform X2 [Canis lupus dingo]
MLVHQQKEMGTGLSGAISFVNWALASKVSPDSHTDVSAQPAPGFLHQFQLVLHPFRLGMRAAHSSERPRSGEDFLANHFPSDLTLQGGVLGQPNRRLLEEGGEETSPPSLLHSSHRAGAEGKGVPGNPIQCVELGQARGAGGSWRLLDPVGDKCTLRFPSQTRPHGSAPLYSSGPCLEHSAPD